MLALQSCIYLESPQQRSVSILFPITKTAESMASIAAETRGRVGVTADMADNPQSEEKHSAEYLQGWALTSLTLAFMSICFVLALDNTILGSWFSQE